MNSTGKRKSMLFSVYYYPENLSNKIDNEMNNKYTRNKRINK